MNALMLQEENFSIRTGQVVEETLPLAHTMYKDDMRIEVFPSQSRGLTNQGWLQSRHSFSFGNYYNSQRLGFGTLRVINEDIVEPRKGFGMHEHENMEIVTIVLNGQLEHKDSLGNQGIIAAGQVQRMSAGSGITHSEFNPSSTEKVHFLQIWVFPSKRDIAPSYEQKSFVDLQIKNQWVPLVKGKQDSQTLYIHQDATFYYGTLESGGALTHHLKSRTHGDFLFVIEGEIELEDRILKTGDAAQISETKSFSLKAHKKSQLLLIEVTISVL